MELRENVEIKFPEVLQTPSRKVVDFIDLIQTVIPLFDGYYVKSIGPDMGFRLEKYFIEQEQEYEIVGPYYENGNDIPTYNFYLLKDGYNNYLNPLLCGFWLWMEAMDDNYYAPPNKNLNKSSNEGRLYERWFYQLYDGKA